MSNVLLFTSLLLSGAALALFLWAGLRPRWLERASQILMAALVCGACFALWMQWSILGSADVVVVFDETASDKSLTQDEEKSLRAQLKGSHVSRWTAIAFPSLAGSPADQPLPAAGEAEPSRKWAPIDESPPLDQASSLQQAIDRGLGSWTSSDSPLQARRLVVLCRSRKSWQANVVSKVNDPVEQARRQGVVVDFVFGEGAGLESDLEITVPGEVLPAEQAFVSSGSGEPGRSEALVLRMRSSALESYVSQEVEWKLEEGVIDPPSWESRAEDPLAKLALSVADLKPAVSGNVRVKSGGIVEWQAPLAEAEWPGKRKDLRAGHHLIRCRLRLMLPGLDGKPDRTLLAETSRYLTARYAPVIFLVGPGNAAPPVAAAAMEANLKTAHEAWSTLPHHLMPRWPDNYFFEFWPESKIDDPDFRTKKLPSAAMVVVVQVSGLRWAKNGTQELFRSLLNSGVHVMVSGAPGVAALEEDSLLPAVPLIYGGAPAASSTASPAATATLRQWVVDRKPRLTLAVDASRLGILSNTPQDALPTAPVPLAPTALALQHQVAIALQSRLESFPPAARGRTLPEKLLKFEGLTSTPASLLTCQGTPDPWVATSVVRFDFAKGAVGARDACNVASLEGNATHPADKAAQVDDFLQLWLPSSIDHRLAPLLPKELWGGVAIGRAMVSDGATDPVPISGRPPAEEFSLADVVVVFAYEVPQARWRDRILAALAARGSLVMIVPIRGNLDLQNGIADRVSAVALKTMPVTAPAIQNLAQLVAAERKLIGPLRKELGLLEFDGAEGTALAEKRIMLLDPVDSLAAATARAEEIARLAGPLLCQPDACDLAPLQYGRWIDERIPLRGAGPRSAAPRRFQLLAESKRKVDPMRIEGEPPQALLLADARVSLPQNLYPRFPLQYGDLRGRGLISVTGWSLFEDRTVELVKLVPDKDEEELSRWSIYSKGKDFPDRWGPQRVVDVFALAAGLEQPSGTLSLRRVEYGDARGNLRLVFAAPASGDWKETLATKVSLRAEGSMLRVLPATLNHVDPAQGELHFEVAVNDPALKTGMIYEVQLEEPAKEASSPKSTAETPPAKPDPARVYVIPARAFDLNRHTISIVVAMARFTGGNEYQPGEDLPRRGLDLRSLLLAGAVAALGLGWLATTIRRWGISGELERAAERQLDALTDDPPQPGDIAERGYSLSRPTTLFRSGPFAYHQAIEPGDRLDDVVLSDLLLWTHPDPDIRQDLVPRVTRRNEEHGVSLGIAINLGWSMWLPGGVSSWDLTASYLAGWIGLQRPIEGAVPSPKLLAAIHVAEILADLAWAQGAEITFFNAAAGESPVVGPWRMSPGPGILQGKLLKQKFAVPGTQPRIPSGDFGVQRWIYISDFLHEDFDQFDHDLQLLEGEGSAAGGVMVVSALDRLLTDVGATLPFLLCDRNEAVGSDLEAHLRKLQSRWSDAFVDTLGGLAVVASQFNRTQQLAALDESRLQSLFK